MDLPSPNGSIGRDHSGRFAPGNAGGPGNPFAKRTACLRSILIEAVSDDDLKDIIQAVTEKAKAGDMAAVKIILDYCIGKPTQARDPDRLVLDDHSLTHEKNRVEQLDYERSMGHRVPM